MSTYFKDDKQLGAMDVHQQVPLMNPILSWSLSGWFAKCQASPSAAKRRAEVDSGDCSQLYDGQKLRFFNQIP